MDTISHHERRYEEAANRGDQAREGRPTAVEELRTMLDMAKRQAQVMQENTKATEAKARAMISVAKEKASKEMMEMVVKGHGKMQFGSEKVTPIEYIERMTNAT